MGLVVAPTLYPITIYQGATFKLALQWLYGPTEAEAVPVDLTDAIVRAQVRNHYQSTTAYIDVSTVDDTITADATGHIELVMAAEDTALLLPAEAVWDMEVEWEDGDVCRLLMGPALISPEVTRDA